ncbi:hypothetical protein HELRODRAFT_81004, partial [Helobdella robusta]|uniref:Helicase ATP-binding domain-containing protein n=1 Tax=Helobdella robusta TaxID=6412 RepID=T1G480_HELRO
EAAVIKKISELRKNGLWSMKRMAKSYEPTNAKVHWDYVLEEMQWLANDFAQERKLKRSAAKKVSRLVTKFFQDIQQKDMRAEKEDTQKLKKIASNISKSVKEFWSNIEKVVIYKQQSRVDEKRKKALDQHLKFIVDQTEKYSTWLSEGLLNSSQVSQESDVRLQSSTEELSRKGSVDRLNETDSREIEEKSSNEFSTEKLLHTVTGKRDRGQQRITFVKFLCHLLNITTFQLLQSLKDLVFHSPLYPHHIPSQITQLINSITLEIQSKAIDATIDSDAESYSPSSEDDEDDDETILEQEKIEKNINYDDELLCLEKEGNLPIEELYKMYYRDEETDKIVSKRNTIIFTDRFDDGLDDKTEKLKRGDIKGKQPEDGDIQIEQVNENNANDADTNCSKSLEENISSITAQALSLQPTGYTLETAHVKTPVSFLLKHNLREYQHVGLDWLATMYEQKLNGILADEMGLGKTIQTIALLSFLATEKCIWGPHLIVVPTSVMLNWEMEFKKWCPGFKILTYYGSLKERKLKRQGWTKTNAFHVCITSYKLVIQDHQAFRRKKWKYFILDEAHNIKNFKSQRWQTLLNFHSQRRLLLTGTPLQNNLMELWSLMHFLMPHVFQSHSEFKEWFSNPLTGMIEGSKEYNDNLIRRLHKVLRPFLLRRLKQDVEKQMPKKYEHVIICRLAKHQRYLYDDFMSQTKTKETLASGHFMSVINILMQLRKVCNHPNLFDPRPIVSPYHMEGLVYFVPRLIFSTSFIVGFIFIILQTFF